MMTPWGYEMESIPPLVSVEDFNTMTGGAYVSNPRVETALLAASQAVRDKCGWHVSPSATCTAYPEGGGYMLRLPAAYVSGITSITEDGAVLDSSEYEFRRNGLVRRKCHRFTPNWDGLTVVYTAGYDAGAAVGLAETVRTITEGVLSVAAGVTSESADGVTISYKANASSIAAALTDQQDASLAPYKVVNAHAT